MAIIREVHTTIYSKSAADIIAAALKYVGTGLCYTGKSASRTACKAKIDKHPNGEMLVTWNDNDISTYRLVSYIRDKNDINARKWLAWQIKDTIHKEFERECADDKHRLWKRDNKQVSKYLTEKAGHDITIQEAYCIYDILMDRKNVDKRFPKKLIEDFRGTENDPFKTEMEVQRRNEIKLITDEYQKKIDNANVNSYYTDIRKQMDAEIAEIRKRYEAESKKLMAELTVERDNKLKELNEQFAALNAIQLTPKQTQLRFSCQRYLLPLTAFLYSLQV